MLVGADASPNTMSMISFPNLSRRCFTNDKTELDAPHLPRQTKQHKNEGNCIPARFYR